MTKYLKWVPNVALVAVCLAVGYYYLTKSTGDSLADLKIECGAPSETTGSAEAISALVNDVLNRNGVENMVSPANVLCSGYRKFLGSQLMVMADPARDDDRLAAYRAFLGGQRGDFALQGTIRVDDALFAVLQRLKAPLDVKRYLTPGSDLAVYRKQLRDAMGHADIIVPAANARPFLIITRETSW